MANCENPPDSYPAGMSPFELLPPEVAEITIRMVMKNLDYRERHLYLVDVLAQVSTRFKALAALKSLWQGIVWIHGDESLIRKVIGEFLGDGTTALHLFGRGNAMISGDDIHSVANKCLKLEYLGIQSLKIGCSQAWKSAQWKSLKNISMGRNMPDMSLEAYPCLPNLSVWQGFDLDNLSDNFTYHPKRCKIWGIRGLIQLHHENPHENPHKPNLKRRHVTTSDFFTKPHETTVKKEPSHYCHDSIAS